MTFSVEFSRPAQEHLRQFRKRDQRIIIDAIAVQLSQQPDHPTRHRKVLEKNELAPWELRVGDFRVFYDVDHDAGKVIIVGIGEKSHGRLRIGSEEIEL
jgi:mRNA-degrading endonuclease RelE of RelBE toxin-antitoxin system